MRGAALCGFLTASSAQAATLTLLWDPNPEREVAGYLVYVGERSGVYTRTFNVGNQTVFLFSDAVQGRPYYFAVAAYTRGLVIGPRSAEVWTTANSFTLQDSVVEPSHSTGLEAIPPRGFDASAFSVCADAAPQECYAVRVVADGLGPVSSLAATSNGLFFIEADARVRVVADGALQTEPALEVDGTRTRLTHLAVNTTFEESRVAWVGEAETRQDGARELSIRRYREVQYQFGEGARIVSGLPMSTPDGARFTVDDAGGVYVAMPAGALDPGSVDPYAGLVLRFDPDGAAPPGSRGGSPILAHGYASPSALAWDAVRERLWLSGRDPQRSTSLAQLATGGPDPPEWPRIPRSIGIELPGRSDPVPPADAIAFVSGDVADVSLTAFLIIAGQLYRARVGVDGGEPRLQFVPLDHFGTAVTVAAGARHDLYVAIRRNAPDGSAISYSIVALQPQARD